MNAVRRQVSRFYYSCSQSRTLLHLPTHGWIYWFSAPGSATASSVRENVWISSKMFKSCFFVFKNVFRRKKLIQF